MRGSARAALLGALLLAAPAALGLSDAGKRSYQEGVQAIDDQDWERAARRLREAVKDDPAEGLRKFRASGVNYEDYFPHLYLGLALEKLDRPVDAERELEESQRQGFSRERSKPWALLTASLGRVHPLAVAQLRPAATPTPLPTRPAAQPTVPLPTPTPAPPRPVPTLPRPTAPPPTPTPSLIPATPTPPVPHPTIIPIPAPPPAISPEVLADLRGGIRAYFRGQYDTAIPLLERRRDASATARLFLSYALAGKYLLAPSPDGALLERARGEYRAARAANAPAPEDKLISRSVRSILETGHPST